MEKSLEEFYDSFSFKKGNNIYKFIEYLNLLINLEKIINEKDQRTTLMIKNIPRNIIQSYLMEIINTKFENLFNFFYLPIDFIKKENAGYAFINFKNSKNIVDFY